MPKLVLDEPKPRLVLDEPEKPDFGRIALPRERLPGVWDYDRQLESLLRDPEQPLENFLPLDVRYDFGQIIGMTEKPDETREKMKNSLYYSVQFGIPPRESYSIVDEIMKMTKFIPTKAKPEERGFFGKVAESWRRGDAQVMADISIYETAFEGRGDEEQALAALKKLQMKQVLDPIEGSFLAELVYSGVEIVPGMARGYWEAIPQAFAGLGIGAGMALAAGQVPPLTLAPEEIVGVPAGALTGAKFGLMTGSAMFWYKQGAGSMYAAMRENDYNPEISKHIAGAAAVPYAIVEFLQVSQLTPGMRRGALKIAQKSMLKVVANATKKYGTVWGTEVFEEVVQEIIQIGAEDVAGFLSDKLKLPEGIGKFLLDRGRRVWETTKAAGKAMALLPIPGAMIDVYTGKRALVPTEKKPEIEAKPGIVEIKAPERDAVKEVAERFDISEDRAKAILARQAELRKEKAGIPLTEAIPAPEKLVAGRKAEIAPTAKPEAVGVAKLTKTEEVAIAKLEAEVEEPFEMVRIKDVGFVIKEKATGKEVAVVSKRKEAKIQLAEFNKMERKIKITRRKPKLLTDKTTISKLITEARALKEGLKKVAQAARKAFTIGKREGIEKVKAQYFELKAREKGRKELKKRVNEAVKIIKTKIPTSVDFFYREAIEALQAGIDPSLRMAKTLRQREKTKEFLAREPEALKDMPIKLIKTLQKKSIGEYTVAELEQIAEEIEKLKKLGKLKRKLKLQKSQRESEEVRIEIEENITKGEPIKAKKEPIVYSTTREGIVKTAWEKTKAWTWRPSRIFDMLDGGKKFAEKAHQFFIDQVNRATDAKLRMVDKRKDAGTTKMDKLGINFRDLTFIRTIDGVKYSVDEMIGIYNANKNRLAKLAIMYGNNLTENNIKNIIDGLSEAEKAWGDYIVQDYDNNYERLRQEVIRVENRDMGFEENYTPMRRTEIDYTTHTQEIIDEILQKESLRKAYAEHGFTIKRKEVPAEFQKPIRLNATSTWLSQIAKQEHYIHFAQLVKDMHRVARGISDAVEQQYGKEFNKVIRNYIDRVANPNIYKSYNSLENLSRKLRQNAVIAYLAYNLVTMGKQIPSMFLYLQDAGPAHLLSSAMDFVSHPIDTIKMVREKDPQVKHRAIERELEEMKTSQPERYWAMVNKFGKAGMEGIYLFDAVARTIGWNAVYQKSLKSGKSEAEAVRLAQNATLRTQPAAAAKDLAQLYATNEFANWFTMFTNQLNQIYNIATYDFTSYVKNAEYQKAALALTGLSITALTIWIITHRRLPEDAEDFAEAMGEQAINAVPLVGKALMAGKRGWGSTEIPAFELPKAVGRSVAAVVEGEFDNKDLKAIAEGIAVTSGLPFIGPKRVIKVAETGELKEIVGGEPIEKRGAVLAPKKIRR